MTDMNTDETSKAISSPDEARQHTPQESRTAKATPFLRMVALGTVFGAAAGGVLWLQAPKRADMTIVDFLFYGAAGALLSAAGPVVERNGKKFLNFCVAGGIAAIILVLMLYKVLQYELIDTVYLALAMLSFSILPGLVAFLDTLAEDVHFATLYSVFLAATGGLIGISLAAIASGLMSMSLFSPLSGAIYGGFVWGFIAVAKTMAARELAELAAASRASSGEQP